MKRLALLLALLMMLCSCGQKASSPTAAPPKTAIDHPVASTVPTPTALPTEKPTLTPTLTPEPTDTPKPSATTVPSKTSAPATLTSIPTKVATATNVPTQAATATLKPSAPPTVAPTEPAPSPTAQPAVAKVIIASINIKGSPETIVIKNAGTADQDMTGWVIRSVKGDQRFGFPNGFILKAGASVTIQSGEKAQGNPPDVLLWSNQNIWNNDGDPAELYDNNGKLVDKRG